MTPKRYRAAAAAGKAASASALVGQASIWLGSRARREFDQAGDGRRGDFRVRLACIIPGDVQFGLPMIVVRLAIDMPKRCERDQNGRERKTGESEQRRTDHPVILHPNLNKCLSPTNEPECRRAAIIDCPCLLRFASAILAFHLANFRCRRLIQWKLALRSASSAWRRASACARESRPVFVAPSPTAIVRFKPLMDLVCDRSGSKSTGRARLSTTAVSRKAAGISAAIKLRPRHRTAPQPIRHSSTCSEMLSASSTSIPR